MKRFFSFLFFAFLALFFIFCGRKGPLIAPVERIPQTVKNFGSRQKGAALILKWTNPTAYADGSPLSEIEEIEIWLYEQQKRPKETEEESSEEQKPATPKVSLETFKDKAELKVVIEKEEFPVYEKRKEKDSIEYEYLYKLAKENLGLKRLTFGLRIKDMKDKVSEFSNLIPTEPGVVSLPPQDVQSTVYEDRIDIEWKEPEKNIDDSTPAKVQGYVVYKKGEEELPRALNSSLIKEKKYSDKDFIFGKVYHYFIRASSTESSPFLESDDSETLQVLAKDIFAPEAPTGLVSMRGGDFISLSWDVNQEKDLLGYRVWRREEGQEEYTLLTPEPVQENVYSDTAVEKNRRYHYAITAMDKNRNESKKSEAVSELIEGPLQ